MPQYSPQNQSVKQETKEKKRAFGRIPIRVWEELSDLSNAAVKIAAALAGAMNCEKDSCEYSVEALARIAGVSRATAAAGKHELVKRGLLTSQRRGRGADGKTQTSLMRWSQVSWVRHPNYRKSKSQRLQVQESTVCTSEELDPFKSPSQESSQERKKAGKKRPAPDPRVKLFIDWFAQEFQERTKTEYIVKGGKEGALVKELLKKLSLEELQAAALNMFDAKWPPPGEEDIGILSSKINTWRNSDGRDSASGRPAGRDAEPGLRRRQRLPSQLQVDPAVYDAATHTGG